MSLSRSPSPVPGGGWSSPGLNINSGRSSPSNNANSRPVAWESSKMRNGTPNGRASYTSQNQGFFTRHMRRISNSLPQFHPDTHSRYAGKEQFGLRRSYTDNIPLLGRAKSIFARMGRKMKFRLLIAAILFFCILAFYNSRKYCASFATWGANVNNILTAN